ncbi:hypothetical protein LNTAR_10156 [Lentisphaera araneosa HTCC2155]|uniref:Uncharacterized protein n=1 Tax=Lentisphaera araneosa HTCC2155 TaxID=313628 RepID=A6DII4_9BACT|nr:hypothetical protein LNTAR_10156 [Lentisphaera araneosa HTCC2155]
MKWKIPKSKQEVVVRVVVIVIEVAYEAVKSIRRNKRKK